MDLFVGTFVFLLSITLSTGVLQRGDYIIKSDTLPDVRFRPVIGNGHLATNVLSDTVYMNGLFNGREDKSSRARIQAYIALDVADDSGNRSYKLDMYHGLFQQAVDRPDSTVTITYYAHRLHTRLLVTHVHVSRKSGSNGVIAVQLTVNAGNTSVDFTEKSTEETNERLPSADDRYSSLTVKDMEIHGTERTRLHVYQTVVPDNITLPAGSNETSVTFIASISEDKMDAKDSFKKGKEKMEKLMTEHIAAWEAVWTEGRVDVEGNPDLSQTLAAASYYILCSIPDKDDPVTPFFGLSPGGLSRGGLLTPDRPGGGGNDYAGHVFWDMDTWMMPPFIVLHPRMTRRMISSRTRVLDRVKENAKEAGFKGAKFPWEQAATGIEATPKWAGNTSFFQIHITADVAYGLRQYLYATGDVTILDDEARGFELALDSARFWQSRVNFTKNPDRAKILGVMGPDEYHFDIDNSVYTNYNAKLNLLLPQYIVDNFHVTVNQSVRREMALFKRTADLMYILFDDTLQYHPQYEDFNRSLTIKQSDVILLGYPLMMPMSSKIRRNDLEIYENITDPAGPDTGTWSMHTVGWLELGDEDRARTNFNMMFRNVNPPFKVFSENPVTNTSNGGCVNFITAAGGMLQSVLFGYGGLRLHADRLTISTHSLPNATSWSLIGVHYRDVIFDITHREGNVAIKPTQIPAKVVADAVMKSRNVTMKIGQTIRYDQQEVNVYVSVLPSNTASPKIASSTKPTSSAAQLAHVTALLILSVIANALLLKLH